MDAAAWHEQAPWDKYRLSALAHGSRHVLTARSVVVLLGLDLWPSPEAVDIATYSPEHAGRDLRALFPHTLRRHVTARNRAELEDTAVIIDDVRCQDPPVALAKALCLMTFPQAVITADSLARAHHLMQSPNPRDRAQVREQVRHLLPALKEVSASLDGSRWRRGRPDARRALAFASPLSESAGESLSRSIMHELGFAAPLLQQSIHGDSGRTFRVDFAWPDAGVVGEFDGLAKYTAEGGSSRAAQQKIAEERDRQREIERAGFTVVRWMWKDVIAPVRLHRILREAGVPELFPKSSSDAASLSLSRWERRG